MFYFFPMKVEEEQERIKSKKDTGEKAAKQAFGMGKILINFRTHKTNKPARVSKSS